MEWSSKSLVQNSAVKATSVFEILLANPKVSKVWVWTQNELTDQKGNKSVEDVMNVAFTKENAKGINWPTFKNMVAGDYNKLLSIADGKFIHPAISKELDN